MEWAGYHSSDAAVFFLVFVFFFGGFGAPTRFLLREGGAGEVAAALVDGPDWTTTVSEGGDVRCPRVLLLGARPGDGGEDGCCDVADGAGGGDCCDAMEIESGERFERLTTRTWS